MPNGLGRTVEVHKLEKSKVEDTMLESPEEAGTQQGVESPGEAGMQQGGQF